MTNPCVLVLYLYALSVIYRVIFLMDPEIAMYDACTAIGR